LTTFCEAAVTASLPPAQGLYSGQDEHDACGVAFVVDVAGRASHDLVDQGLTALRNMEHRGASGSEPDSGDGAGILVQVPDAFLRAEVLAAGVELPAPGSYAVGTAFLPASPSAQAEAQDAIDKIAAEEGLRTLIWRDVPVDPDGAGIGVTARSVMPVMRQLFLGARSTRPARTSCRCRRARSSTRGC
jgi:glutamate synthase (NADPH/NADH) large chain